MFLQKFRKLRIVEDPKSFFVSQFAKASCLQICCRKKTVSENGFENPVRVDGCLHNAVIQKQYGVSGIELGIAMLQRVRG